jgi:class 3 adenylate cyclase
MAERIDGARLVELEGGDHVFAALDLDALVREIVAFVTGAQVTTPLDRYAATVLFTDIVASTEELARVGDREWSQRLDQHDQAVRRNLDKFDGNLVTSTGDGALAMFDGPARAVRCACTLREDLRGLGLGMRAGLHTGEIQRRDRDIAGLTVHIAARLEALAEPGEVLVSQSVTDLVAGSGIDFRSRGSHALKGVPGRWPVFAVENIAARAS